MADKVLQDPSKQKLFEHSQMHELFEFPKKLQLGRAAADRLILKHNSSGSPSKRPKIAEE